MPSTVDDALSAVLPHYGLARLIYDKVAATKVDAPAGADLVSVTAETERQENEMRRLEAQAKVAQEMAIASRIETAAEVEIEEFYEYGADGKVGLNADEKGVTVGASASGRRISKRVYRFTGKLSAADHSSNLISA